jgi:tetratricopeptide (TPR) repeat protein
MTKKAFFALLLLSLLYGTTFAIGEVTPTPVPTLTPAPLLPSPTPALPFATATPMTANTFDEEAALDRAIALVQSRQYDEAIALLTEIVTQNPNNAEAYAFRALSYLQTSNTRAAIDDFTLAIAIVPYSWEFYTFRGSAYLLQGESGEAKFDFDRAIDLNPRYDTAFSYRSTLYLSQNDRINSDIDAAIADGIGLYNRNSYARAIARLTEAINANPADKRTLAYALYNRALATYIAGDKRTAITDYSLSLEAYPDMHDSYLGRGIAYRETDQLEAAGRDFARRIELLEQTTLTGTLSIGVPSEVNMDYGVVARYTFVGNVGDVLTFSARDADGSGVDPLISLLAPDGQAIAGDDDFGGELDSLIERFSLPVSGTYTLVVSHANGGYTGLVRVLITR